MNDEKKKLIVLMALVGVIACIGAFQLLKGKPAPPPLPPGAQPAAVQASSPTGDGADKAPEATSDKTKKNPIKNPQVANDLPPRDPFELPSDQRPRLPQASTPVASKPQPFPRFNRSLPGIPPMGLQSSIGGISPLPNTMGNLSRPVPTPPKPFDYKVVGAISGDRPAVVLQDASGNQKLVPEGSAIDGDSRVRRVEKGAVVIEYRGRKLRLTVGENSK